MRCFDAQHHDAALQSAHNSTWIESLADERETDVTPESVYGKTVAEGHWLYAGMVPTRVRVVQSEVAFGSGDYEDEPEDANDRHGRCFYVEWGPAGGGSGGSLTGPFATVEEAKAHVQKTAGSVSWSSL
jgi:hypothetical protein